MKSVMKNILMMAAVCALAVFPACRSTQMGTGTDDVYANPAEEKRAREQARIALEKQAAEEKARQEQESSAKREQEAKNPYYKEPDYSSEDYYDYEYSARINRFYRPLYGAGYYDPFYTNNYTYNQNPALWGTSIYTGVGWGMPSTMFAGYSMGISTGWGYGYNRGCWTCYPGYGFYDPFWSPSPYGMAFYDPWAMYYPMGYGGFYNGYYTGYNQGYVAGYYNRLDANSNYGRVNLGPRGGSGSNSGRGTAPESSTGRYIQNVAEEQSRSPRFTPVESRSQSRGRIQSVPATGREASPADGSERNQPVYDQNSNKPRNRGNSSGRIRQQQPQDQPRGRERSNNEIQASPPPSNPAGRDGGTERQSSPRGGSGGNTRPRR
jgi:hypothetical protein